MSIDAELLKILACPGCRGSLEALPASATVEAHPLVFAPEGLACAACAVVYPVRNCIPVLLKAEGVSRADWDSGRRR